MYVVLSRTRCLYIDSIIRNAEIHSVVRILDANQTVHMHPYAYSNRRVLKDLLNQNNYQIHVN